MSITERPTDFILSDIVSKLIKTDLNRSRSIASRSIRRGVKRWPETKVSKNFIVSRLTILYTDVNLKSRAFVIKRMLEPLIRIAKSSGEISNDLKVTIRHCGNNGFEEIGNERYIWVSCGVDKLDYVEVLLKLVFVDDLEEIKRHTGSNVIDSKDPERTYYYQH